MPKPRRVSSKIFFGVAILLGGLLVFVLMSRLTQRVNAKKAAVAALQEQQRAGAVSELPAGTMALNKKFAPARSKLSISVPALDNSQFKLKIPFISQAPTFNWDIFHEDYCEEASLLMAVAYLRNKNFTVVEQEAELTKMREWEEKTFGYFESTTVSETARIAREYLGFKNVRIMENPTSEKIRAELIANHIVIIPANGKALHNPFFKNGGPPYHMLVARGFIANGDLITNDPGTRHGENFVYKKDVLLNAIHDFDHGPNEKLPASGAARLIVIE